MKVLNFGSLNIDYVYSVEDFVKKGETISSNKLNVFSGGKGLNQSISLSKAGVNVCHAGMIGHDGTFDNCIILYGGANQEITKGFVDTVLREFASEDWLVLQNEINEIPYIVEQAHKKGMKIILNPSPMNKRIFEINLNYIDCFILNEIEAQELTKTSSDQEILKQELVKRFPNAEIVLTLGEQGAMYLKGDRCIFQRAYRVEAVDTTAAGDTFTGYYLAGRIQQMPVEKALDMAAKASAIAVSRKGAAPSIPSRDEVTQYQQL